MKNCILYEESRRVIDPRNIPQRKMRILKKINNPRATLHQTMRPEAALRRCSQEKLSGNMQQIYRRTIMPKCNLLCNFIEITLRHSCSPVNLLHIFKTPFPKNTYEELFLFDRKIALLYSFAIIQD